MRNMLAALAVGRVLGHAPEEFAEWAARVAETHGYTVEPAPVGVEDAEVGPPSQMAVFRAGAAS